MRTQPSRPRALLLAGALVALAALVGRCTSADRAAALRPGATLPELLTALAGLAVLAALGWLALLTALLALEGVSGRPLTGWAGCPAGVRRLLLVACGVATATALAVPADAAVGPDITSASGPTPAPVGSATAPADHGTSALLDGLPMPDRPTGPAPAGVEGAPAATPPSRWEPARSSAAPGAGAVRAAEATARPAPGQHPHASRRTPDGAHARPVTGRTRTVRAGDTLWDVAAQELGPRASAAATARAWRVIYAANRDLVGTDPDLIQPGTTLRVPPTVQEDRP